VRKTWNKTKIARHQATEVTKQKSGAVLGETALIYSGQRWNKRFKSRQQKQKKVARGSQGAEVGVVTQERLNAKQAR